MVIDFFGNCPFLIKGVVSMFNDKRKMFFVILLAALVCAYILPLGGHPLMDPDEGRYSEIPREMVESGDYVTPKLNYVKYFEKPVFLYWANAAAFKAFGENEFALRITVALCALLGVLASALLAGYMYGKLAGWFAAVVCGSSFLYFAIGTLNITDMPLSFFLTLAMAAFYVAQKEDCKRFYLLFYAACALAVLTKGLVGVVLPGGIILVYILVTRKWRLFYKPLYVPAIVLFFVITVPWFWLVCRANPDFFRFFFIQEHFQRYLTKMHDRYEPFWFFIPMVIAGVLPWTAFLPGFFSRKSVLRSPKDCEQRDANRYLVIWFAVIFLFFSASDSKLIPYIVPCIPPLAILIAAELDRMVSDGEAHGRPALALALTSGLFGIALVVYPFTGGYVTWCEAWKAVLSAAPALILMPIIALRRFKKGGDVFRGVCALMLCSVIFICGIQQVYGIIAPTRSLKDSAAVVNAVRRDGDVVVTWGEVLQGLSFYTKQRAMVVGGEGELAYGAAQPEGKGWFVSREEFKELWKKGGRYIVVLEDKHGDRVKEVLYPEDLAEAKVVRVNKYTVLYREVR